jgi:hypothetical protein
VEVLLSANQINGFLNLTRRLPAYYSVIKEIVEGFVEGFFRQGKLAKQAA